MKKSAFCYLIGGWREARIDYLTGSKLTEDYGLEGYYVMIPANKSFYKILKNKKNVEMVPDFINNATYSANKSDRKYFDHDLPENLTFELLRFSDLILRDMPREKAFMVIENYLSFWNNFFEKHRNIKCVITYPTGGVIGRTAYCVAQKRDILYLTIDVAGGNILISDKNEDYANKKLIDIYELKKNTGLLSSESKKVSLFVHSFKDRKVMLAQTDRPTGNLTRRFKTFLSVLKFGNDCKWTNRRKIFKNYLKILYRYYFGKFILGYDKIRIGEKFIFFPLHAVFDMQVLVRSPFYFNQAELVRSIALSLPSDTKLYVKEHPESIGYTPIDQLKTIKGIENVRLLDPAFNSHDIIKNSEAVITIASTAGWEAFLYEKPVITLGKAFYSYSDLVHKIGKIEELPKLIKDVIKNKTYYNDNKKLWEIFIHSFLEAIISGNPTIYLKVDDDLNKKEADKISKALFGCYLYNLKNKQN